MSKNRLFDEFPSCITSEEWKQQIIKDLKGADYNEKLLWNTDEGFSVEPYSIQVRILQDFPGLHRPGPWQIFLLQEAAKNSATPGTLI